MSPSQRSLLALVSAALLTSMASGAVQQRKPNVVFILADDLGWRDTSLYGSTYLQTPNIEKLASRGMRFDNAYAANPLCSPTRASILTGLYPARIGITAPVCHLPEERMEASLIARGQPTHRARQQVSATRLSLSHVTLAENLKTAGYSTAHFGKWHLGPEPFDPLHQGFDEDTPHFAGPGPAGGYLAPWRFVKPPVGPGKTGDHIEDRMAQEAAAFIRRNKERPFFLNYWSFSVHSPWDAPPDRVAHHAKRVDPGSAQRNPVYAAMVERLDAAVGTLMQTLEEEGLTRDTIIVFFSDNGGVHWRGQQLAAQYEAPVTSNAPLRGGKATLYEGGTREPCVVVWPGRVRPGSRSDAFLSSVDWHPTLLEMTGAKASAGQLFDGLSQVPALLGRGTPRKSLFCFFPHYTPATGAIPGTWVREGKWKLIRLHHDGEGQKDRFELYNLDQDIGETRNLADREPARVRKLDGMISEFLAATGAVTPDANPAFDPNARAEDPAPPAGGGRRPGVGAPVLGWSPSRDCTLQQTAAGLRIDSTGADPYLTVALDRSIPAVPLAVEIRMSSTARGAGQFFWREESVSPPFFRERSRPVEVIHDAMPHSYRLEFSPMHPVTAIRLDPAAGAGVIVLQQVTLRNFQGEVVWEWKPTPSQR